MKSDFQIFDFFLFFFNLVWDSNEWAAGPGRQSGSQPTSQPARQLNKFMCFGYKIKV